MKYLEVIALDQAANGLCQTVNGVRVDTVIEAFSCKPGSDKKLYKSMDHIYSDLATSPDPSVAQAISVSPFGPLSDTASRKTFIFLVATLNAVFPDYDFSDVKVEEFRHEDNYFVVANGINTPLASVFPQFSSEVQESMWKTVDREIDIKVPCSTFFVRFFFHVYYSVSLISSSIQDCEIYSFLPDPDSDPFYEDGYL